MQFDSQVFDQFAFEGDATITGEHIHEADIAADIIKSTFDEDNRLEYKENLIEVSKGLTVLGPLSAPNWTHEMQQYPVDPAFNTIVVAGKSTTDEIENSGEIVTTNLTATTIEGANASISGPLVADEVMSVSSVTGTSFISSGSITGQTLEAMQRVHAPHIEATTDVKAPKVETTELTATSATIPTLHFTTIAAPTISSSTLIDGNKLTAKHIEMVNGYWKLDIWPGSLHMRNETALVLSNILLDSATGKITCNGGIDCSNDNHPFNITNPSGLIADYIQTKEHKSVFGTQLINPFNMYGISIEAAGTISTPQLVIPGAVYGSWGGLNSSSVWHTVEMTTPLLKANHLKNSDENSQTHLDMSGSSVDVKVEGNSICSFTHDRTHFTNQVDFTGLTENDIINWPLHQHGSVLNHIIDHGHGVKIMYDAGDPAGALGNLLCKNIITGTIVTGTMDTVGLNATGDVQAHKLQALDSINADVWLGLVDGAQLIKYESTDGLLIGLPKPDDGKSMQIKLTKDVPKLEVIVDDVDSLSKSIVAMEDEMHILYKERQPPVPTPQPQPTPAPFSPSVPADIPAAASFTNDAIAFYPHVDTDGKTQYDAHHFSPSKHYHSISHGDGFSTQQYTPTEDFKEQGTGEYKVEHKEILDIDAPTGFIHKANRIRSYKGDLRRHLGQTHDFMDDNGTLTCFKIHNEQTQTMHLSHEQLEALEGQTGVALKNALLSTRNPRTVIKGTQATFGLHTNEADAGDVHLLLTQDQADAPSYCAVSVDRQVYKVSNKEVISGAYVVDWTGYNMNDHTTKEHGGARIAINNQTSEGKLYLGRWDRMLPNNADNDNPADFWDSVAYRTILIAESVTPPLTRRWDFK